MEIHKIENPEGELIRLEFTQTNEPDFKAVLMAWVQANYPDWGYQGFFKRMTEFRGSSCLISMLEGNND